MVSLQKIYDYLSKCKPDKVADYSAFLEHKEALSEDRKKEIQADLTSTLEEIARKDPEFAKCMKDALSLEKVMQPELLRAEDPEVQAFSDNKKFLPGGMHDAKYHEQAILGSIASTLYSVVNYELGKPSMDVQWDIRYLEINGLEKSELTVGKPRLVYHPYKIVSVKEPAIRDLESGITTHLVSRQDAVFSALADSKKTFDSKPLPGSFVTMPLVEKTGEIYFYPKEIVEFSMHCPESLDIRLRRVKKKQKLLLKSPSADETWRGYLSDINAAAEIHPNGSVVIVPKQRVDMRLPQGSAVGFQNSAYLLEDLAWPSVIALFGGAVCGGMVAAVISASANASSVSHLLIGSIIGGILSSISADAYYLLAGDANVTEVMDELARARCRNMTARVF